MDYLGHIFARKKILSILLFFFIAVCLYAPGMKCGFILDDTLLILENPCVKSIDMLPRAFGGNLYHFSSVKISNYYRPLLTATYAFDYRVWGPDPFGFHLTNIILHAANSCLVFFLILGVFGIPSLALMTGILFCIHPVQSSAVAYISGRADLLVVFFILLASIFFVRWLRGQRLYDCVISFVFFLPAILSRENALLMPAFAFLLILTAGKINRRSFLPVLGFLALAGVYVFARPFLLGERASHLHVLHQFLSFPLGLLNLVHVFKQYAVLCVWPWPLYLMRTVPVVQQASVMDVVFISLVVLLCLDAARQFGKKDNFFSFGFFWAFIGLIPLVKLIYGLPQLGVAMAEHWLYLGSLGIFCMVAGFFYRLKKYRSLFFLMLCFFYGSVTLIHNSRYWRDEITILRHTAEFSPKNNRVLFDLGRAYEAKGLNRQALQIYEGILERDPSFWRAYNQLGNIYLAEKKFDEARNVYEKSLSLCPDSDLVYYNLGVFYGAQGQYVKAFDAYRRASEINPASWMAFYGMGDIYLKTGHFSEAVDIFKRAVMFNPDIVEIYRALAWALLELNRPEEARGYLEKAFRLASSGQEIKIDIRRVKK